MADDFKKHFIRANGIRFHVVEAGHGPPILFLHGFPEFWYSWRHQMRAFTGQYRVIAPDLRGYNETDKPPSGYDLHTLADDVAGIIDALDEKKVLLVGHDWGGVLAWFFAHRYPDRIEKLAVLNSPHPRRLVEAWLRSPRQAIASLYITFFQIPRLPEFLISRRGYAAVAEMFQRGAARKDVFTEEDIRAYREAAAKPGAMTCALNWYRVNFRNMRKMLDACTPPITAPTLVIWTDRDFALSLILTQKLERFVSAPLRVEVLKGLGHWTQQEAPDEVNRLLAEFFRDA